MDPSLKTASEVLAALADLPLLLSQLNREVKTSLGLLAEFRGALRETTHEVGSLIDATLELNLLLERQHDLKAGNVPPGQ